MSRARDLADLANNAGGLETLTVSDITDLSVSASNINSTTNQITDSSTDLNVDSNTLVVDKSANAVGIGTTPSSRFTVNDSGVGAGTAAAFVDQTGGVNDVGSGLHVRTKIADSTDHILKCTSTTSTTTRFLVRSDGNIGIGTDPAEKLHVDGNVRVEGGNISLVGNTGTISPGSSGSGYMRIFGGGTNEGGAIEFRGGGNSGDLRFYTGTTGAGTERIRIDNGGKIELKAPYVITGGDELRERRFFWAATQSNGSAINLFRNSDAYSDLPFILHIEAFHGSRSYVIVKGTIGGYGLGTTTSGIGSSISLSASSFSGGKSWLRATRNHSTGGQTRIAGIVFGDNPLAWGSGVTYYD